MAQKQQALQNKVNLKGFKHIHKILNNYTSSHLNTYLCARFELHPDPFFQRHFYSTNQRVKKNP